MADKKISELTALTGANVATDDQLVIVDTSAALTKNITIDEFKNALDTATGFVRITGDTMTGDLSMGDNVKAIFGAGSDLQIYHDGSNSYIKENGTGQLVVNATNLYLRNSDNTQDYLTAVESGATKLLYADVVKLATTSTGVDITGTLTSDGLTVDGNAVINSTGSIGYAGNLVLTLNDTSNDYPMLRFTGTSGGLFLMRSEGSNSLKFFEDAGASLKSRMFIAEGGDISFYEDTGTTAKFFWDASAENITINHEASSLNGLAIKNDTSTGTTTGAGLTLHAHDGTSVNQIGGIFVSNSTWNYGTYSPKQLSITGSNSGGVRVATVVAPITFHTGNSNAGLSTERMRIDSSGNVGIGTTDPATLGGGSKLTVNQAADGNIVFARGGSTRQIQLGTTSTTGYINADNTSGGLAFHMNGSERMRLDASGNLLVGTTDNTVYNNSGSGTGINLQNFGNIGVARDGNDCMVLNRLNSDGDILVFHKDGSSVGSIGTSGGNLTVQGNPLTGKTGIKFGGAEWIPQDTGANSDGGVDLGGSSYRFKDLYLSGGVYLGGTGAANKLEDYEEGTYVVTLTPNSGTITINASYNKLAYTKIGRQVTITGRFRVSTVSSPSGDVSVNLPFTSHNGDLESDFAALQVTYYNVDFASTTIKNFAEVNPNATQASLLIERDNLPWTNVGAGAFNGGEIIYVNGTYLTDS